MYTFLKYLSLSFLGLFFFVNTAQEVKASHAMGADISYVCLGNDSFEIRMNFYRFCDGISAPNSASVNIFSPSGCGADQSVTLSQLDSILVDGELVPNGADVTPLCDNLASSSNCGSGSFLGVEQYTYSGIVQLNTQCPDWTIAYNLCCRNPDITNLQSPASQDLYIETTLNNTVGCNNSPQFTTLPVPYVCEGRLFNYNQGAVDVDGDSLVFTSINPLDNGQPIPYVSGFSPSNPLNTSTPFTVDPNTGQISFTPTGNQFVVITILVEEFRNGVLVGSTMRDIQVSINSSYCSDQPVNNVSPDTSNVSGGVVTGPSSIEICPGDSLTFHMYVVDTTAGGTNDLVLLTNSAQGIPGSSFVTDTSATGDTLFGTFTWVPTGLDTGNNVLVIEAGDQSQCPIEAVEITSVNIFVLAGTFAGPDLQYCPAGGPLQLNVVGGNSFTWSPADGLSDSTIRRPLASPSQTQEYIVTSNLSSNCKNTDTIVVERVPDFLLDVLPANDTINVCRNGAQDLEAVTDAQWGPYTYEWAPASAIDDPFIATPTALVDTTTDMFLTVTSDTGCTIRDTITLNVVGVGPKVNVLADKEVICPGDTVNFDLELFPLACGPAITGCGPGRIPVQRPVGTDSTSYFASPFSGSNDVGRSQLLYRASDLKAAGMNSGTIYRLAFEAAVIQSGGGFGGTYENLTIKMGCTEEDNLSTTNFLPVNTTVWGPQNYNIFQGTLNFNLYQFQEYDWDGESNIVIEFCYTNPGGAAPGGDDELITTSVGYTAMARNYQNNVSNGCALSPSFSYSELPNVTFTICDPSDPGYTYSWTPASAVSEPDSARPYTIVNDTTVYRVEVQDTLCYGSGEITLAPQGGYGIEITPGDTFICNPGDTLQLGLQATGNPPPANLECGANSTQCAGRPSAIYQVGNSTTSSSSATPYYGFYEDSRVQYLFRASELAAAGITSGTITSLAWDVATKNSSQAYSGYTIRMSCTSLNQLSSSSFATGSFTTVFGPSTINSTTGWNTHTLSNTFDWDGVSNIIIEVCFNNTAWTSSDQVRYSSTSYTSSLHDWADGSIGCSLTAPSSYTQRPNIRFNVCEAPSGEAAVLWTPNYNISNDTVVDPFVFPDTTTDYIVDYTFVGGCTVQDTVTIGVSSFATNIPSDTSICAGDSVTLSLGGDGNVFTWTPNGSLTCGTCAEVTAFPDTTTTYNVLIEDSVTGCSEEFNITVAINELPDVNILMDSIVCFIDSITLNAGEGYTSYFWNDESTDSFLVAYSAGEYFVEVTDSFGCANSDTVTLKEGVAPDFNLPNDTIICDIDSFVLEGPSGDYDYYWSNASNDSTISAFVSGTYSLTVVDTIGCASSDSVNLLLNEAADLNLGNDTVICEGTTYTLDPGIPANDFDFLWSDGITTDPTFTVSSEGLYSLTITDTSGCTSEDSIYITYNNGPAVDLGPDRGYCIGQSTILNPGTPLVYDYTWGPVSSNAPQLSVNTTDLYSVTVVNEFSCPGTDSVFIEFADPEVEISGVTAICDGEPATLEASPGFATYFWLPGEENTQSITVTDPGQYSVSVVDSNGCEAQASVTVSLFNVTPIELGPDQMYCYNESVTIGVDDSIYVSYEWAPNGDTTALIDVSISDQYTVTATDANGCTTSDSISVEQYPETPLELEDINTCSEFTTNFDAGSAYIEYTWSTGDSTQSITITEHGNYSLTAVDSFNCSYIDEFSVVEVPFEVEASADPNIIELGESSVLTVTGNGSGDYGYVWTADPEDESLTDPNAAEPSVSPEEQQNIYTVVVTDSSSGCVAEDTTLLLVNSEYALPNAFMPNGNNADNQYFDVIGASTVKTFQIFNRWGELVYNNDSPSTGWDGTYNGKPQPVGTYIYYVVVLNASGEELPPITGNVSLIR
ncbi:MAG: gliding motility-associated C-terminal domain-containing protein [Chitinophagales bacterium]